MERTRREFLQQAAVGSLGMLAGESVWAREARRSPNERIQFACIGVGGKGDSDSADAARLGDIVAICDVDDNTLAGAAVKYPGAKKYNDYRKMLDEMSKQIEAVTVSTPDHHHGLASAYAM